MDNTLVLLKGKISSLQSNLLKADFFLERSQRTRSGDEVASSVLAVAAAAMGLSGAAMATATTASARFEDADRVSFDLNGEPVEAWLWRNPFTDGDDVEVVASKVGSHWEALAVARPSDRIIAMYPHLARGRRSHVFAAAKLWLQFVSLVSLLGLICFILIIQSRFGLASPMGISALKFIILVPLPCVWAFFLLPGVHLTWRWMYFVRIAEDVFRTFGWKDVERIDLRKSSKGSKGPDVFGYGYLYYRY